LATLNEEQVVRYSEMEDGGVTAYGGDVGLEDDINQNGEVIQEVSASGMFALDALSDVENTEKLQYVYEALGPKTATVNSVRAHGQWAGSADVRSGGTSEPYIVMSRGEEFADSHDAWFFAKTFPTLFPFGAGGP
jgi:hypothetical protein